jgi:DNA-binding NarL/FixJ family response regulator
MAIRVVVADDSLLVREGLQHMLEGLPQFDLCRVARDEETLIAAIEDELPDVILTDIRMPPGQSTEGLDVAKHLRETHPEIGVIVISQYAEPHYALALLEDGSAGRGYLLKDRLGNREQLVSAIEQVAAGGSVIDPLVVEALVRSRDRSDDSPLRTLTPREREVLGEVAAGKSNAAIARSLVITKRAVERHISSIFSKLDLPDEEHASRRVTVTLLFLAEQSATTLNG